MTRLVRYLTGGFLGGAVLGCLIVLHDVLRDMADDNFHDVEYGGSDD